MDYTTVADKLVDWMMTLKCSPVGTDGNVELLHSQVCCDWVSNIKFKQSVANKLRELDND